MRRLADGGRRLGGRWFAAALRLLQLLLHRCWLRLWRMPHRPQIHTLWFKPGLGPASDRPAHLAALGEDSGHAGSREPQQAPGPGPGEALAAWDRPQACTDAPLQHQPLRRSSPLGGLDDPLTGPRPMKLPGWPDRPGTFDEGSLKTRPVRPNQAKPSGSRSWAVTGP